MTRRGRRCVLDDKKKDIIIAIVKSGCGRITAARFVECAARTITNTANRDPDFAKKLSQAESAAEIVHIENINRAGRDVKYWRASAWMLERLHPDRFGKSSPDAVSPSQMASLIIQLAEIVIQEVPAPKYRKGILKRLDRLLIEARLLDNPITPQQLSTIDIASVEPEQANNAAT